ncbi:MAG: hypothetical protein KDK66_04720 [Deltaproteobacteria bacterium]|nr:hypothetical protein [Deltaproteobacteria bacterium]
MTSPTSLLCKASDPYYELPQEFLDKNDHEVIPHTTFISHDRSIKINITYGELKKAAESCGNPNQLSQSELKELMARHREELKVFQGKNPKTQSSFSLYSERLSLEESSAELLKILESEKSKSVAKLNPVPFSERATNISKKGALFSLYAGLTNSTSDLIKQYSPMELIIFLSARVLYQVFHYQETQKTPSSEKALARQV